MKLFLNREPVTGPWGGGNKTLTELISVAKEQGWEICHTLEPNIDVIFCFDPRPNARSISHANLLEYKKKNTCKIIQRVGDVGTHGKPELTELVKRSVQFSDFIIFPSNWARETIEYGKNNFEVIQNAPRGVFRRYRTARPHPEDNIRLITHHWSTNVKKGFEFYRWLDAWIENKKVEFTYIGRLPSGFEFNNTRYLPATGDDELLAKALAHNDIYLTASREEAGANHVLEGLAAGLPVAFHKAGGSINEYCDQYGLSFSDKNSFQQTFEKMINNFDLYKGKAMEYNRTVPEVAERYMKIICNITST